MPCYFNVKKFSRQRSSLPNYRIKAECFNKNLQQDKRRLTVLTENSVCGHINFGF